MNKSDFTKYPQKKSATFNRYVHFEETFNSTNYVLNASGKWTFNMIFSLFEHLLVSGFYVFFT